MLCSPFDKIYYTVSEVSFFCWNRHYTELWNLQPIAVHSDITIGQSKNIIPLGNGN